MENKIQDIVSGRYVNATPEEVGAVQPFAKILLEDYGYPKDMLVTHPQVRVKASPSDKKGYPIDIAVEDAPKLVEISATKKKKVVSNL
ncbi:hypothetical protein [Fibrobacter sp. UWP2]|uniref:hypothetical protein n=1 Tax=Fibrobacter sp. UWP2 TaxID=1896216 RepID=UPI000914E134|nr:hypothetical protein [Fibrobacter sp. UWP2]SHJ45499.1 hypothetical protein SAMN05720471_1421 [Fibrobacter sp. UWP2]